MENESEPRYFVHWNEEISASSPEDAARRALAMLRDPEAVYSARVFAVHAGTRELSIEVTASGATTHVLWDSAEQVGSDGMYVAEFYSLPPEKQLRWKISDYLSEQLSNVYSPHPEGWVAECLGADDADDLAGPDVGFLIQATGIAFKVTIEPYEEEIPSPADVTEQ